MATESKVSIAVVVEDQRLQDYIVMLLVGEGYEVKAFSNQNDAITSLEQDVPDLIISEFQSPNINGLDICKILRKSFYYNLIPIFFLIPDEEPLNTARLIFAGADDYLKKSLIQEELFLKVKLNLYRIERHKDIDNTTRLPGQSHLLQELKKRIDLKDAIAVNYVGLYHIKDFNYRYGFERGDQVIHYAAALVLESIKEHGNSFDFLAHLPNNDFIYLTSPDKSDAIANTIIERFDRDIHHFYDEEDKLKQFIMIKSRTGDMLKSPFIRIHIGMLTNAYFSLFSPTRIIQIASEIKDLAYKTSDRSMYIKETGKNYSL